MISIDKILNELNQNNNALFRSFFLNNKFNFNLKKIKNYKKFKTVIIIGMGGSILAAKSIYSFLINKTDKNFIFIDNLNLSFIKKVIKQNNPKKCLFLVISKSGNTIETLVNTSFFSKFLTKRNTIIISEHKSNSLRYFAIKRNIYFINHNAKIGGRYSVFSDVGMLPAYLMGFNPEKFKSKIPLFLKNKRNFFKSLKNLKKLNFQKKKILVLLNYIPELTDFLYWCQQLLAESLGKKNKGFTPIISNAPKDHHSLLQLYLDGPKDKIFYIFSRKKENCFKVNSSIFGKKSIFLNKKKFSQIRIMQKNALIKVFKEKKILFREIIINKYNEETLGLLFFSFIYETIVLGKLFKVNPYDQPAVERVKILTKKNLA